MGREFEPLASGRSVVPDHFKHTLGPQYFDSGHQVPSSRSASMTAMWPGP